MDNKNFEYLKEQLQALGFPSRIAEEASHYMQANKEAFHIYYFNQIKEDELMYDLHFLKGSNNDYQLKEYELRHKNINIPDRNIQGINTKDLDEKLKEVNGLYDKYYEGNMEITMSRQNYEQASDFIKATNNDLYKLAGVEEGKDAAKLLMYKYFPESEYERFFQGYQEMQKLYEHKHLFPVINDMAFTATEAYQFLKTGNNTLGERSMSEDVINQINSELLKADYWIAYNTVPSHLDRHDAYFFDNRDEANDFAESNISEFDNYKVIKVSSVDDVLKQSPDGEQLLHLFAEGIINNIRRSHSLAIDNNGLYTQLEELGFGNKLNTAISFYERYPQERFQLPVKGRNEKEAIEYWLNFEQRGKPGNYQLTTYKATLSIFPDIPNISINGTDVGQLDNAMRKFDWSIDHHTEVLIEARLQTTGGRQELKLIDSIFHNLNKLHTISEGKELAEKLMFKYWSGGPYEPNQFSLDYLKQQYQFTCNVSSDKMISKTVAYEMLKTTAAERTINQTNSFTQKTNFMNQKNFDYLKDQVKFTGFGEGLEKELKENMQKQTPEFQITHNAKFGNDDLTASLHFKKSDQTDMYFFNRYQVSLTPEQLRDKMEQTFYINKEGSITLKEAYNLMNARSVNKDLTNKEGQVYNAWMQMDFKQTDNNGNYKLKQFHQNYGYDLISALEKHPIKELTNEQDKARLAESLQKGNRQSVTFVQNGNEQKHFIEANPQFKTINIYDGNMQRLNSKQGQNEKQGQGENNSAKQTSKNESPKQSDADDSDEMPKASNKRRKKQSNSIS